MSQGDGNRTLLRFPGEHREFWVARPSARECAIVEELAFVRREAQAEADIAYDAWRTRPSGETYAVYRATQDRADAAQDELARCILEPNALGHDQAGGLTGPLRS